MVNQAVLELRSCTQHGRMVHTLLTLPVVQRMSHRDPCIVLNTLSFQHTEGLVRVVRRKAAYRKHACHVQPTPCIRIESTSNSYKVPSLPHCHTCTSPSGVQAVHARLKGLPHWLWIHLNPSAT